jgi:hypothetical protein
MARFFWPAAGTGGRRRRAAGASQQKTFLKQNKTMIFAKSVEP